MTINWRHTLLDIRPHLDLCCWTPADATELIGAAGTAARMGIPRISVAAASVPAVWSWLEKSPVALSAMVAWNSAKMGTADLVREITLPLKRGADQVQLYAKWKDLPKLSDALREIRDEIFFDKKLSLALSLDDVPYNGWLDAFKYAKELRADNIMLIAKSIKTLDSKYFNFLDSLEGGEPWGVEACVASDAVKPLEDIFRLTKKMLPDGMGKLRIIVRPEFMKNYAEDAHEDL
ncbi:MAG: hypothetical protein LBH81_00220 [Rickettsiales bacterium]|jgi:hypothetical protein|nr:hypothetical protein [Rickettsiales bacterium]